MKAVYNPKASIPHAALLRQGCPHCAIFPTAASRRSLGRVSVPMWPVGLSTRLPVVATVGRHPAVKLMGRDPVPRRLGFGGAPMRGPRVIRYYRGFRRAIPVRGVGWSRVTHPFATLCTPGGALTVRLACVRHAASVHPEPGSNSPFGYPSGHCPAFLPTRRASSTLSPVIRHTAAPLAGRGRNRLGFASSIYPFDGW